AGRENLGRGELEVDDPEEHPLLDEGHASRRVRIVVDQVFFHPGTAQLLLLQPALLLLDPALLQRARVGPGRDGLRQPGRSPRQQEAGERRPEPGQLFSGTRAAVAPVRGRARLRPIARLHSHAGEDASCVHSFVATGAWSYDTVPLAPSSTGACGSLNGGRLAVSSSRSICSPTSMPRPGVSGRTVW